MNSTHDADDDDRAQEDGLRRIYDRYVQGTPLTDKEKLLLGTWARHAMAAKQTRPSPSNVPAFLVNLSLTDLSRLCDVLRNG